MQSAKQPWHGVLVASALPLRENLTIDFDLLAEHVRFLAENGCDGISVNGSLGEYHTLSVAERSQVVTTAVQAAPEGFQVMVGTGAYGSQESRYWADQAADAGATSLLSLPPNAYAAARSDIIDHYRVLAEAALPVVAYNNPLDTKVNLAPDLLAQLHGEGLIVGVKEFSLDCRRGYQIRELAPELDVLAGSDDTLLEFCIAGAVGWVAGYPNALPASNVALYRLATSENPADWGAARDMYRDLHSLFRWDSRPEFVQAIKLSMDVAGRHGGPCRAPRGRLAPEVARQITADTEAALAKDYR